MSKFYARVRVSGIPTDVVIEASYKMDAKRLLEAQYGASNVLSVFDYSQSSAGILEQQAKDAQERNARRQAEEDKESAESRERARRREENSQRSSSSSYGGSSSSFGGGAISYDDTTFSSSAASSSGGLLGLFEGGLWIRLFAGTVTMVFALTHGQDLMVALSGFIVPGPITLVILGWLVVKAIPVITGIASYIASITLIGVLKGIGIIVGITLAVFCVVFCLWVCYDVFVNQRGAESEQQ
jgi:hypothetical protein